jgi:hypothetical protein
MVACIYSGKMYPTAQGAVDLVPSLPEHVKTAVQNMTHRFESVRPSTSDLAALVNAFPCESENVPSSAAAAAVAEAENAEKAAAELKPKYLCVGTREMIRDCLRKCAQIIRGADQTKAQLTQLVKTLQHSQAVDVSNMTAHATVIQSRERLADEHADLDRLKVHFDAFKTKADEFFDANDRATNVSSPNADRAQRVADGMDTSSRYVTRDTRNMIENSLDNCARIIRVETKKNEDLALVVQRLQARAADRSSSASGIWETQLSQLLRHESEEIVDNAPFLACVDDEASDASDLSEQAEQMINALADIYIDEAASSKTTYTEPNERVMTWH